MPRTADVWPELSTAVVRPQSEGQARVHHDARIFNHPKDLPVVISIDPLGTGIDSHPQVIRPSQASNDASGGGAAPMPRLDLPSCEAHP